MGKKATETTMLKVWFAIDEHNPKSVNDLHKETKVSWDAVNSYCFLFWHMGIVVGILGGKNKSSFVKIPNTNGLQTKEAKE